MYKIVKDFPNAIMNHKEGPFISIYQPTHKLHPDNEQDPIRFKNLIKEVEESLEKEYPKETAELLKPLWAIEGDSQFWNHSSDGLAVLANKNACIVYRLDRTVEDFAVVADSFHIKPLLRKFQSADNYHVLGIMSEGFDLYEGNRYGIKKINLREEAGITVDPPQTQRDGGKRDEMDVDMRIYFRYVDDLINDNFSNVEKLPLILAGLEEHQGIFREISKNQYLIDAKISKSPELIDEEELRESAWELIEPVYIEKTKVLVDRYEEQRSKFLASDDVAEIARAAVEGRVETLIIQGDYVEPGSVNEETGEIKRGDLSDPKIDDILDDLGEIALKTDSEVVVLPEERMPTKRGIAAIFRY